MSKLGWFVAGAAAGLTAAAISREMEKSPEQRTWKGTVAGVPYNFRVSDWSNVASEYWNPGSERIIVPHVIGLGWGVNFAAVTRRVQHLMEAQQPRQVPEPIEH